MNSARYFAPKGIEEALKIRAEHGETATVLAGGTDLVPKINYYDLKPAVLLYIGGIGLDYVREEQGVLRVGAGTTWAGLISSSLVTAKASVLSSAARQGGCVATRNAGTIGGNVVNASPAADLATPLLVMDTELLLESEAGKRTVAVRDFFTGPGETVLRGDEILVEMSVPRVTGKTVFIKLGRRKAMTLSVVNVAVRLDMDGRTCKEARIALGSMGPTPMRCTKAEEMLNGTALDEALIRECAVQAIAESRPIDDQRATAWYRKSAGEALLARALAQAAGKDS